jgi:peptidyl-prolyl cis-trans isomerase SurA
MAPALRTYLTDLREKAYVDIAPGFVDTGASPKETKPVYAASTPPAAKKKTKKGRLDQARPGTPAATSTTPATAAAVTPSAASPAPVAASTAKQNSKPAKTENVAMNKKPRKVHREKIRYGQAPRNSLPVAPEETLASGSDQGPGAANTLPPPGAAIASIDQSTTTSDVDPLAPKASQGKTRFADRAPLEAKTKTAAKTLRTKQKAAATPPPLTAEEKAAQQVQNAPLGLRGDTATKKKPKKVKGAPKERIQEAPPTPPAPKPDATPIPPKSVRDNGEPVVTPPPSNLPPPATGTQPAAPANPAPAPQ